MEFPLAVKERPQIHRCRLVELCPRLEQTETLHLGDIDVALPVGDVWPEIHAHPSLLAVACAWPGQRRVAREGRAIRVPIELGRNVAIVDEVRQVHRPRPLHAHRLPCDRRPATARRLVELQLVDVPRGLRVIVVAKSHCGIVRAAGVLPTAHVIRQAAMPHERRRQRGPLVNGDPRVLGPMVVPEALHLFVRAAVPPVQGKAFGVRPRELEAADGLRCLVDPDAADVDRRIAEIQPDEGFARRTTQGRGVGLGRDACSDPITLEVFVKNRVDAMVLDHERPRGHRRAARRPFRPDLPIARGVLVHLHLGDRPRSRCGAQVRHAP
mmetsp:Transcript_37283/g.112730  ORF Transcript_37283/g.112730 Transcript_37283/m.112730 type:complete len:325 (+) Transcript_37283:3556-4530(+)